MKISFNFSAIIVIAVITIASFSSCKKSSSPVSIVGNWEVTSINSVSVDSTTTPYTSSTTDTTLPATSHGHTLLVSFNANLTFTLVDYSGAAPNLEETGSYIVIGNKLTLFDTGSSNGTLIPFVISGNTLTLTVDNSYSEHKEIMSEKFIRQ